MKLLDFVNFLISNNIEYYRWIVGSYDYIQLPKQDKTSILFKFDHLEYDPDMEYDDELFECSSLASHFEGEKVPNDTTTEYIIELYKRGTN